MKRTLLLAGVLGMGLVAAGTALAADPDEARQEEIMATVQNVCAGCHGADLTGLTGPALTPEALKGKDAAALADTILNGRPDTLMMPFASMFSKDDALWLVHRFQSGIGD